jgi:hypothetical protein
MSAPTVWSNTRCVTCGHEEEPDHDAGKCTARMNGEQCLCSGYTPAWQVNT